MTFDTAIITPGHALLGAILFCITNLLLFLFLRHTPKKFFVPGSDNTYYAGWILVLVISIAACFELAYSSMAFGLAAASICVIFFGRIDENKNLSAWAQLFLQAVIALIVVYAGWSIPYITNIFHTGIFFLNDHLIWGVAPGALVAFVWIIACMNAVNFLDGTDGLASGVTGIACIALAGISLLSATQDVRTFELAIIGFSSIAGFFIWNAPPARIYLGTTGSWFLGLYIALLAIIGGGKISTTLIVLALPILDALFVLCYRAFSGIAPWKRDTVSHLHHRLAHAGLSKWNIVFVVSVCTFALGSVGVFASTEIKIVVFIVVALLFFTLSSRMMKGRTV